MNRPNCGDPRAPPQVVGGKTRRPPQPPGEDRVTRTRLAIAGAIAALAASCTAATSTMTPPPASSPTAATTPSPTTSATPSAPALPTLPPDGAAEPGTYLAEYAGYRYTLNVPDAGWTSAVAENGIAISTDGPAQEWSASLIIWGEVGPGTALYEKACQWAGTNVTPGSTVGDLADALGGLEDFETSGPMDVTVGGHDGKRVELTVPMMSTSPTAKRANTGAWTAAITRSRDRSTTSASSM